MAVSLRKQAVSSVLWSAAGTTGNQLATLAVFVVLSRLLTPDEFGLIALVSVFTVLLRLIAEQGFADAIVQQPALEREHLDTAFWVGVGVGGSFAVLLAAAAPLIARLVDNPDAVPVLVSLSSILLISSLKSVQRAILMRNLEFKALTSRDLLAVIIGGTLAVAAALRGFGVWSLVVQLVATEIAAVILLWGSTDWRPRLRFSRRHFVELFSFGSSVVGFRLLRFVNTRIDNLIVGVYLGTTALGFYLVAYRLLEIMVMVTTSIIGAVSFPLFSRIQADRSRVQSAYYTSISLTSAVAFPAFIGLIVVAPEVVRLVFGGQWDDSVPTMRVLALAGLARSVLDVNGVVMKSLGKPSRRLLIMAATSVLLVASFLVVVQWGILAVATAFTVVIYLMAPLWIMGSHRLITLDARRYLGQIAPAFVASCAMMVCLFVLKIPLAELALVWRVVLLVAAGALTYSVMLWLVGRSVVLEALDLARLAIPNRTA